MKLVKRVTKILNKSQCQATMRKLSNIYRYEVVFMPYGKEGRGFYIKNKETL